jgi:fructose-1-phosphate kinase PfkB-like protein
MRSARLVVFDCNIAVDQAALIVECARKVRIPIAAAAVSDSKVNRLLGLGPECQLDLVSLNRHELNALFDHAAGDHVDAVCSKLQARRVVVTDGPAGYWIVDDDGSKKHFAPPTIDKFVSATGAGDALLAGLLTHWANHDVLDPSQATAAVAASVRRVLQEPGATVGSLAVDIDFAVLARIAVKEQPLWMRMFSPEVGVATGIFAAVLTAVTLWLTYLFPASGQ